jgi:hypothetical protein
MREEKYTATEYRALQQIYALRKYPAPQTELAVQKVLARLDLDDLMAVTIRLERTDGQVPRG